ncbi:hypothetical protein DYB30_011952, partial [Aphanomyces astaci]
MLWVFLFTLDYVESNGMLKMFTRITYKNETKDENQKIQYLPFVPEKSLWTGIAAVVGVSNLMQPIVSIVIGFGYLMYFEPIIGIMSFSFSAIIATSGPQGLAGDKSQDFGKKSAYVSAEFQNAIACQKTNDDEFHDQAKKDLEKPTLPRMSKSLTLSHVSFSYATSGDKLNLNDITAVIKQTIYFIYFSLLLLDEATSALDPETEANIVATLERLARKMHVTVISVTHRLSTTRNADTIIVLDDGKIVETGTYKH